MKYTMSLRASAKQSKAETILEVIIAVAVIMVILAPASALYISSMRNTAVNRNELAAAALAEEGIEIVRNIRDTNFIKFSDKVSDCWNTAPNYSGDDCADANNKIAAGSFRLAINVDQAGADYLNWTLEPAAEALTDDLSGAHDGEYRLTLDAGINLYYHAPPPQPGVAAPDPSPFYREVTISYADLTNPPDGENDAMKVFSKILYRTGITVRAIERVAFLTREPS